MSDVPSPDRPISTACPANASLPGAFAPSKSAAENILSAGNWPKVLRVVAAAGTYALLLLALCRGRSKARIESFIAAGAAAGAVSGLVRPSVSPAVVVAGMLGAGLLLAPLHWLALRRTAQR